MREEGPWGREAAELVSGDSWYGKEGGDKWRPLCDDDDDGRKRRSPPSSSIRILYWYTYQLHGDDILRTRSSAGYRRGRVGQHVKFALSLRFM